MRDKKNAIVLLSGGLDSTTVLALAQSQGFNCCALSFSYGQRHQVELAAAKKIARACKVVEHKIFAIDHSVFRGSSLTDVDIKVPAGSFEPCEIPTTYVPARNTVFLSIALAWAEVMSAQDIFIGVNAVDYSGYPDCRPEYIQAYEAMANLATKAGVEGRKLSIHAPLISLTKAEIIILGMELGVEYANTVSCYRVDKQSRACGKCDSCLFRKQGFIDAGIEDPTSYI